jgi:Phage integrase family.
MPAMIIERTEENKQEYANSICEYQGISYFVLKNITNGKCFIEVDGERKYLDKNGCVANKQPGKRNVKDCIDSYEDMLKIYYHLLEKKRWNIYLLFVLNYNLSRRIGDLFKSKWSDFFDENWKVRKFWELEEEKTHKLNEIEINKAVRIAFKTFFDNESAFEKTDKNYHEPVFKQLHGTHKGKVLSHEGYRQALIKVENELNLGKRLRSHGFRRGAFTNMIESHPNDPKAKVIVMDISKHSSEQMLSHYIGDSDKNKEKYLDDLGNDFIRYVINGEEVPFQKKVPQVVCNTTKLMECMRDAATYFMVKGIENANETDPKVIMETMNDAMKKVEEILENIAE